MSESITKNSEQKIIKLVECPRDAMQGWPNQISTENKIEYLNSLLKVGFPTLDFGSFVSPKAIPQMADTAFVVDKLNLENTATKLLAIVANERGAQEAAAFEQINYLGFPFSLSETFQMRNTNSGISQAWERVQTIQEIAVAKNKELVIYISMGFGNPYGDAYNQGMVYEWVDKMKTLGIKIISLADTVGIATAEEVLDTCQNVLNNFSDIEIGVHLHSSPFNLEAKALAALQAGCLRFDAALKGIGGCPMAGDALVGNMDTEKLIKIFEKENYSLNINKDALAAAAKLATKIFV